MRSTQKLLLGGIIALLAACGSDEGDTPSIPSAGIAQAKALVANVRDTINGIEQLESPANAFGDQADLAAAVLAADGDGPINRLFDSLALAIEAAVNCFDANTDANGDTANATCTTPNTNDSSGAAQTLTATITGGTQKSLAISGNMEDVLVDLTLSFPNNAGGSTASTLSVGMDGTVENNTDSTPGTGLRLTLDDSSGLVVNKSASSLDAGGVDVVASADFDLDATLAQIRTPGSQAGGPIAFQGILGATVVRCTKASCVAREQADPDEATFTPGALNLSGAFSNNLNSVAMSAAATVANAANFDPGAEGELSNGNFPDATVTLDFDADLGNVAPAHVTLTGDLNGFFIQPDGIEPNATVTMVLTRGTAQVLRIEASSRDAGTRTAVSAVVTDDEGAAITLDFATPEPDVGDILVDGVKVGDVEDTSNAGLLFRYVDGSFESLF